MTPDQEQSPDPGPDRATRFQHAIDVAYRYLGHRDRTVVELRRHLESKRVEPDSMNEVVAELQAQGYVDDARYAIRYAEDRRALDSWGADRIERTLLQAGVAPEHIAAALASQDGEQELDAAVALLRRRLRAAPQTDRERERALGMLVRKGYALDLAYAAVRAHERDRLPDGR